MGANWGQLMSLRKQRPRFLRMKKGIKAWLITLEEPTGTVASTRTLKIISILPPLLKPRKVKTVLRALYVSEWCTNFEDKLHFAFAHERFLKREFKEPFDGYFAYGDFAYGPKQFLCARKVENLICEKQGQKLSWLEYPKVTWVSPMGDKSLHRETVRGKEQKEFIQSAN
jgi:hypothetical protein